MQIVINKLLTHYETQGKGPAVLFLHGWGDTSKTFAPLIKDLQKQYTCIVLDLPGFGSSQQPDGIWGIEDYSEFVKAFLLKINVAPETLVGHSNGGTIAMFALSHKLITAKKLILLASAGIRTENSISKTVYKLIAKSGKQAAKIFSKKTQEKLRKKLYSTAGSDIFVSPHLEETFKKVVGYDIQKDAATIEQPTLLVYAEDDTATPRRYGDKLGQIIKNSKLVVLPAGGHFVHQTNTQEVQKLIKEFIK
jgi:pimeloyl-ACP methyl ester carboxylesterase